MKTFFLSLLLSVSLFGVEIIVDSSLSASDKRFIDKLLGKKQKKVKMHLQSSYQEPSYELPRYEEPKQDYSKNLRQGKRMFKACAACHGREADRKALGVSKVIANMSEVNIYRSLLGYKSGRYGGRMKGIMKGQVARYDKAQLRDVAAYVSSLR
jgi:cytochrome c553